MPIDTDGVHQIGSQGLEVLLDGIDRLQVNERHVLVNFSADVSDRANKTGPFFSGVTIAKQMGMPLLAIADPTVTRDKRVSLGWYLGNEDYPDLIADIVKLLDAFALRHKCKLFVLGGSGGGFATLNIWPLLAGNAYSIACNPQTSIRRFWPKQVTDYLRHAWPTTWDMLIGKDATFRNVAEGREAAATVLDALNLSDDVTQIEPKYTHGIYLQNRSDWHVKEHALPYMTASNWHRISPRVFHSRHMKFFFGAWGEGHFAPSKDSIMHVVGLLRCQDDLSSTMAEMDANTPGLDGSEFVV